MHDLVFVVFVLVFFAVSLGLIAVCQRLMEG
jgi:hypothetical protein